MGQRVHKLVVGMTNGSGNGRLRGVGTDRKRARKEGGKAIFFSLFTTPHPPPKENRAPFFQPHPIKKSLFKQLINNLS